MGLFVRNFLVAFPLLRTLERIFELPMTTYRIVPKNHSTVSPYWPISSGVIRVLGFSGVSLPGSELFYSYQETYDTMTSPMTQCPSRDLNLALNAASLLL